MGRCGDEGRGTNEKSDKPFWLCTNERALLGQLIVIRVVNDYWKFGHNGGRLRDTSAHLTGANDGQFIHSS